jgi:hypothetical protein
VGFPRERDRWEAADDAGTQWPRHLMAGAMASSSPSSETAKKRHRPPCFHPHSRGPVRVRCMLGSVQPGAAIYPSASSASGEACRAWNSSAVTRTGRLMSEIACA